MSTLNSRVRQNRETCKMKVSRFYCLALALFLFFITGCMQDKGGGRSILNLTPEQKVFTVIHSLNTQKVSSSLTLINEHLSVLEKAEKEGKSETKYDARLYRALLLGMKAKLELRKKNPKLDALKELLESSIKDAKHFERSKYRLEDFKYALAIIYTSMMRIVESKKEKDGFFLEARKIFFELSSRSKPYESGFTYLESPLTRRDVIISLIELYLEHGDLFEAYARLNELAYAEPEFKATAQFKLTMGKLLVYLREYEEAIKVLAPFKGSLYMKSLEYDEALWWLANVYEYLEKKGIKRYSVDKKVVTELLRENSSFYASGTADLLEYLPPFTEPMEGLARAIYLYYDGKTAEAREICYDILDMAGQEKKRYIREDADPTTLARAGFLIARCNETLSGDKEESARLLKMAMSLDPTSEVAISSKRMLGDLGFLEPDRERTPLELALEGTSSVALYEDAVRQLVRKVNESFETRLSSKEIEFMKNREGREDIRKRTRRLVSEILRGTTEVWSGGKNMLQDFPFRKLDTVETGE